MARRPWVWIALAAVGLAVSACGADKRPGASGGSSSGEEAAVLVGGDIERVPARSASVNTLPAGLNHFGFDYYALLASRANEENLVFSPLSIALAFGMAGAGARGETLAQIEDVFHFPVSGAELHAAFNDLDQALAASGESTLRLANRLFPSVDVDLVEDFVEILGAYYGAPAERLDLADAEGARQRINAWVADRTENRIPELLPEGAIDPEALLVLVNALYLEAKWSQPFDESATKEQPFTRRDGSLVDVPLMHESHVAARYADAQGFAAVELPYGNGELSMLVVVPATGEFDELERDFGAERLAQIDESMRPGVVDLYLPRWEDSLSVDLVATLPELGLTLPFDKGVADFTGIAPKDPYISAAIHAANIEVNEQGTVAAAATAIVVTPTSLPPPADAVIRADRPFLYLIRDTETGAVLFLGRVLDPTV